MNKAEELREKMYLLAKQVVANHEQQLDKADIKKRNYTYADMKRCFHKGLERGTFVGAAICGREMNNAPQKYDEFMSSEYSS